MERTQLRKSACVPRDLHLLNDLEWVLVPYGRDGAGILMVSDVFTRREATVMVIKGAYSRHPAIHIPRPFSHLTPTLAISLSVRKRRVPSRFEGRGVNGTVEDGRDVMVEGGCLRARRFGG